MITKWMGAVPEWRQRIVSDPLIEDLRLVLGPDVKIKNLYDPKTIFCDDSEFIVRRDQIKRRLRGVVPAQCEIPSRHGNPDSQIFFINGVMSNLSVAIHQQLYLERITGKPVALLYNPTESLRKDLMECHNDRHLNERSACVEFVQEELRKAVLTGLDVHVIGYSQGAIIASAALYALSQEMPGELMANVYYSTFGAGFKESVLPDVIHQEHFANTDDPVVHLGLMLPSHAVTGTLHLRNRRGHLLVADYLMPVVKGEFGKHGHFYSLLTQAKI